MVLVVGEGAGSIGFTVNMHIISLKIFSTTSTEQLAEKQCTGRRHYTKVVKYMTHGSGVLILGWCSIDYQICIKSTFMIYIVFLTIILCEEKLIWVFQNLLIKPSGMSSTIWQLDPPPHFFLLLIYNKHRTEIMSWFWWLSYFENLLIEH